MRERSDSNEQRASAPANDVVNTSDYSLLREWLSGLGVETVSQTGDAELTELARLVFRLKQCEGISEASQQLQMFSATIQPFR